jgi:hypothetical protein
VVSCTWSLDPQSFFHHHRFGPHALLIGIFVRRVELNLELTIVTFAICGCLTMNRRTIVLIVVFAELVGKKIFATVTIVVCALILYSLTITTARLESTCQIARYARKTCSAVEMRHMKCKLLSEMR